MISLQYVDFWPEILLFMIRHQRSFIIKLLRDSLTFDIFNQSKSKQSKTIIDISYENW